MIEVINYLYEQKFIYRDLKPENIIVIENGYIKLIDFSNIKKSKIELIQLLEFHIIWHMQLF